VTVRAAIGLGSNLGDPPRNVRAALRALGRTGKLVAQSRLYASKPWGKRDQPDFCNAVALVETELSPHELLNALKAIEHELGRRPGERWGPRVIDLDILTYGRERIDEPNLQIPHPRLFERAFALVPLAEVDRTFAPAVSELPTGETVALMSEDEQQAGDLSVGLVDRVRGLARAFEQTDLVRLRIEDEQGDAVELRRHPSGAATPERPPAMQPAASAIPGNVQPIKADLVGIFHFSRPAVGEGDTLEGDRELAYVDALGIRNPVRSLGAGRVVAVRCRDGQPVEYGQVLFEIDRG
jgi:2-amino-4-hydroxy-6-hydroxymethyldihydropteridine diphosphokinase